jgi:hypothetical protein
LNILVIVAVDVGKPDVVPMAPAVEPVAIAFADDVLTSRLPWDISRTLKLPVLIRDGAAALAPYAP